MLRIIGIWRKLPSCYISWRQSLICQASQFYWACFRPSIAWNQLFKSSWRTGKGLTLGTKIKLNGAWGDSHCKWGLQNGRRTLFYQLSGLLPQNWDGKRGDSAKKIESDAAPGDQLGRDPSEREKAEEGNPHAPKVSPFWYYYFLNSQIYFLLPFLIAQIFSQK